LSSKPERKHVSVSMDAAILRQLFAYLRRLPHLRRRAPLATTSDRIELRTALPLRMRRCEIARALRGPQASSVSSRHIQGTGAHSLLHRHSFRGSAAPPHADVDTGTGVIFC
jgi:hypothetical protein